MDGDVDFSGVPGQGFVFTARLPVRYIPIKTNRLPVLAPAESAAHG